MPKELCKQIANFNALHFLNVQIQRDVNENRVKLALKQIYRNKIEIAEMNAGIYFQWDQTRNHEHTMEQDSLFSV